MFKNKNVSNELKPKYSYTGSVKICLIISAAVIAVGIIAALIWGVGLDINFKGGSRYTYSYSGDINLFTAEEVIEKALNANVEVTESRDYSGESAKLVVSIVAGEIDLDKLNTESEVDDTSSSSETTEEKAEETKASVQNVILGALEDEFPNNNIAFGDSNTVSKTMASKFFVKCVAAMVIASALLLIYIAFRFRNIGGLSAGVMSLFALIHDLIIAFIACIIFNLDIDMNFVAVVLTILGYSLNDTIVVYDRIRENRKLYPQKSLRELTDESLLQVTNRTITTSVATFIAIIAILVVAEFNGLTTLRSFTIPMALGVISGSYSSLCLAAPLWVKWREYADIRAKKVKTKKK